MSNFKNLFNYSAKQNRLIEKQLKKIKEKQKEYIDFELQKFNINNEPEKNDFELATEEFKKRLANGETIEDIKLDAFALISECFKKIMQKKIPESNGYYDEQIKASLVLANGDLAQMLTGEGKTFALTLATYLQALKGKGVHVVTSNEYLAERDLEENYELYKTLGLSTAFIADKDKKEDKRKKYKSDIVYTTPTTIAFDYLRDNGVLNEEDKVMNGLSSIVLDEVDSSLIDEAGTPFIISDKPSDKIGLYEDINDIIKNLKIDYVEDIAKKFGNEQVEKEFLREFKDNPDIFEDSYNEMSYTGELVLSNETNYHHFSEKGLKKINEQLIEKGYKPQKIQDGDDFIYNEPVNYLLNYLNNAVQANFHMKNGESYIVRDGKIEVVNTKGGRVAEGSKFSNGINQALEAKENLKLTDESVTSNSINQPNLFKLYDSFAGLSGTLTPSEEEFKETYKKNIVVLKPRKGMNRKDENTEIFETKKQKEEFIIKEIKKCMETNRPVLLATSSILESEYISNLLKNNNINHKLLNAKSANDEANIIKDAGQLGSITVTTNIAGRGTDIKPSKEALAAGGIYVLSTCISESKRIDDQLRGRSGRQGNVGGSKFVLSLEDDFLKAKLTPNNLQSIAKLIKEKQVDKLQEFIKTFQKKLELNSFAQRKQTNAFQSVNALIRENFDKEKDEIRQTKDIKEILIGMASDKNNENLLKASFSMEETQKIKENILKICQDYWIDFVNNDIDRKEQANNNAKFLSTKPDDEYLKLSFDEWELYSAEIKKEINEKVISKIKAPEKSVTSELDQNIKNSVRDITIGKYIENMISTFNEVKNNLSLQKQDIYQNIINIQVEKYGKFQIEVLDYITSEEALDKYVEKISMNLLSKEHFDIINERIDITRRTLQNPSPISRKI